MSFQICNAQNRENVWELSIAHNHLDNGLYFKNGLVDTFLRTRLMDMFVTNGSICDTSGNILMYSNGAYIANKKDSQMFDSHNFNPGYGTSIYFDPILGTTGLGYCQGVIFLPHPDADSLYDAFYITTDSFVSRGHDDEQPLYLSYSRIDLHLDKGLGGIPKKYKNIHVVHDTISQGRITACKHGNGTDWWVVTHKYYSKEYYIVHDARDKITVTKQNIGSKFTSNDIYGMACFSPDGAHYAQVNINDTIDLMDFDRCAGVFNNYRHLVVSDTFPLSASLGCAFSPNSRFLYVNTYHTIWQFDLQAKNVNHSGQIVYTFNDSLDGENANWFFQDQLAPDNKIYISTTNGYANLCLHRINKPDIKGKGCDVEQHAISLYVPNVSIPNFPNYDLGVLSGSDCDTFTGIENPNLQNFSLKVYPNPVKEWLNIEYESEENLNCEIFDIEGRLVTQFTLYPYFSNRLYDMSGLPSGIYILNVRDTKGISIERKIVKE